MAGICAWVAAPAGAATLTAPVVHETFTALPCTGAAADRTTLQQEGCEEAVVLKSDTKIDKLNAEIFARLKDDAALRAFVAEHNAWMSYRRRFCVSASYIYQGGTYAPVVVINCDALINSDHLKELQDFLAVLKG